MEIILQPLDNENLGVLLKKIFNREFGVFNSFQAAVAFAKASGIRHLEHELKTFLLKGNLFKIVVGIDHKGTSKEALELLLGIASRKGEVWINHSKEAYVTFHPKIYLFENAKQAILIFGSNNLTEGGLFTNDEGCICLQLPSPMSLMNGLVCRPWTHRKEIRICSARRRKTKENNTMSPPPPARKLSGETHRESKGFYCCKDVNDLTFLHLIWIVSST